MLHIRLLSIMLFFVSRPLSTRDTEQDPPLTKSWYTTTALDQSWSSPLKAPDGELLIILPLSNHGGDIVTRNHVECIIPAAEVNLCRVENYKYKSRQVFREEEKFLRHLNLVVWETKSFYVTIKRPFPLLIGMSKHLQFKVPSS